MPYRVEHRDDYPTWIGLIFVFNLIVGTGALTLPAVFTKAGWALSLFVVSFLAFISYMTVTFVIETMACANAIMHWRRLQFLKRDRALSSNDYDDDDDDDDDNDEGIGNNDNADHFDDSDSNSDPTDAVINTGRIIVTANSNNIPITFANAVDSAGIEHTPLFSQRSRYYVLDNKIELGEMAGLFFNDFGRIIFYLCIAIYLYGDLSIYVAAVAKSMRDVLCTSNSTNGTSDSLDEDLCWEDHTLSRLDVYRLSLIGFIMIFGPFTFFNVQKTKYIQMLTVLFRWLAFTIMISIATHRLITNGAAGHPPAVDITGLPSLFGTCVYAFMCHHSLPSLLSPVSNKKRIKCLMLIDYTIICTFYLLLALTGIFAFANLEDLYTLNFVPNPDQKSIILKGVEYFLTLFPVFTLSASFPIIAITLRNNLQTLFLDMSRLDSYNLFQRRLIFPLLSIIPPLLITYFTESLTSLVSFTGSYAGNGIQYLIPVALVYSARKTCTDLLGQGIQNEYRSPFSNNFWLMFVLFWSLACIILVTVNLFTSNTVGII